MAVWRVNVNGDTQLDPNDARDYARLRPHIDAKTPVYTTSKQYVGMPDYQMVRDTMTNGCGECYYWAAIARCQDTTEKRCAKRKSV